MTEYVITEKHENKWCLHGLAGYNKQQAKVRLEYERKRYPELELRLEETESTKNWWNTIGTH